MNRTQTLLAAGCLVAKLLSGLAAPAQEPAPARGSPPVITAAAQADASQPGNSVGSSAASQPPTAEQIAIWIGDLNDPQYLVREAATQRLSDAGAVALDPLLAAANSDQPEPADRASWILRRFSRSRDNEFALAALERLAQLKNDPTVAAKARSELGERSLAICQQRLTAQGAFFVITIVQDGMQSVAPLINVRLGERWRGKTEDLMQLAKLKQQRHFRLEGRVINDDIVKQFAEKEGLTLLQLFDTSATPASIDLVKAKHPGATLFARNTAMLGVRGDPNAAGVLVLDVPQGTGAAAAGILPGDVITMLDGQKIPDFDRLTAHIAQHHPGDKVEVELMRRDQKMKIAVVLGRWTENDR